LEEVAKTAQTALKKIENQLPLDFPEEIHISVNDALAARLRKI
jgi:hypothetical protein